MGKGDKKTRKGKRVMGSHGVTRPSNSSIRSAKKALAPAKETKPVKKVATPNAEASPKEVTKKAPAKKASTAEKAPAKKATTAKKAPAKKAE